MNVFDFVKTGGSTETDLPPTFVPLAMLHRRATTSSRPTGTLLLRRLHLCFSVLTSGRRNSSGNPFGRKSIPDRSALPACREVSNTSYPPGRLGDTPETTASTQKPGFATVPVVRPSGNWAQYRGSSPSPRRDGSQGGTLRPSRPRAWRPRPLHTSAGN